MREPWFWRSNSIAARTTTAALSPLSLIYDTAQRLRWAATSPQQASGPVICIGNATLGGVGKTPFAILVHQLIRDSGAKASFLTRGYRGALKGPIAVDATIHTFWEAGDEALLLARAGNTVISHDRPKGARYAFDNGADALIMDDGYQNPTLHKNLSILLVDAADPEGNGRVFPAGPLREPLGRARHRADIVVAVHRKAERKKTQGVDFTAWLEPSTDIKPQKVVAFSGIGVPANFFLTLENASFEVIQKIPFPDHHAFSQQELSALLRIAKKEKAALITTEKDFIRLPKHFQEATLVLPVTMRVDAPEMLKKRLLDAIDAAGAKV